MLASWVQQAAFDPPTLTVAVNKKRDLSDWLTDSPAVVLNLVGATQNHFLKHFGKGFEPDESAFEGVETTTAPNGVPALCGAMGWLAGQVTDQLDAGDHTVYLVQLESAAAADDLEEHSPMIHIRKNGFKY
jgi:flavin reductase (DIM6/NTAB) family NADH-FMN oxidoreductase RutF